MAVRLPNGATIAIASAYGASKAMSAVSNANPAVATLEASHGVVLNDILEVTSGWSGLNSRIIRAGTVSTNDVQLAGFNSTSTASFPAAGGTGSVREISTWQQITQVLDTGTAGGEQQFVTYSFLESDAEFQIPTVKSPSSLSLTIGDDASLAHYAVLDAADSDRLPRAIRVSLPGGSVIYYNCYVTLNRTPTLTKNQLMGLQVTLSQLAEATRYAS